MLQNLRIKKIFDFFLEKKWNSRGDTPMWEYLVAIILGLLALGFLMWLAVKATTTGINLLP
ncbi:hypothetical protein HZA97_06415 [Candidatus Woesearchaeota archaeon]|nr:hypothetical protein [Candidatus Woesearchaeota archaeon]